MSGVIFNFFSSDFTVMSVKLLTPTKTSPEGWFPSKSYNVMFHLSIEVLSVAPIPKNELSKSTLFTS